ncbi:hypothetical protein M3A49_01050 [Paraburkholderia sp. CNPSo 3076]|uniref:hypothetical protein n=1 Tax=Paraburkholderia sp. CNPSo 3076 TaxID=2940936 RepID=UPI0022578FC3|nr:hypothetical protein [Paraburkholderia sp. CNPSo 3076]MCX5538098.1 hypothetical protein [Paraburkholderia sp. CNPSo 3076]
MLTEYLFRDDHRLDEYASQINPSLTVIEKTKEWTAGLSLTGPKAEAKQGERARAMTQDEKAKLTLDYLRANGGVHEGRPEERAFDSKSGKGNVKFVIEQSRASRVVVPSNISGKDSPGFVLWLSRSERDVSAIYEYSLLCLLEDVDVKDDQPVWGGGLRMSAYSALQSLYYHAHAKIADSALASRFSDLVWDKADFLNFWQKAEDHRVSPDLCFERTDEFDVDPEQTLAQWGCFVSAPREIETLYRIREVGSGSHNHNFIIFGYPLWISALS